jgi:hypothetical protein
MLTIILDIRSCDSWWQRNGEGMCNSLNLTRRRIIVRVSRRQLVANAFQTPRNGLGKS